MPIMKKGANEKVEVEIKGLFDGHNEGGVTVAKNFTKIL